MDHFGAGLDQQGNARKALCVHRSTHGGGDWARLTKRAPFSTSMSGAEEAAPAGVRNLRAMFEGNAGGSTPQPTTKPEGMRTKAGAAPKVDVGGGRAEASQARTEAPHEAKELKSSKEADAPAPGDLKETTPDFAALRRSFSKGSISEESKRAAEKDVAPRPSLAAKEKPALRPKPTVVSRTLSESKGEAREKETADASEPEPNTALSEPAEDEARDAPSPPSALPPANTESAKPVRRAPPPVAAKPKRADSDRVRKHVDEPPTLPTRPQKDSTGKVSPPRPTSKPVRIAQATDSPALSTDDEPLPSTPPDARRTAPVVPSGRRSAPTPPESKNTPTRYTNCFQAICDSTLDPPLARPASVRSVWAKSKLPTTDLAEIWTAVAGSDTSTRGLTCAQFASALGMIDAKLRVARPAAPAPPQLPQRPR